MIAIIEGPEATIHVLSRDKIVVKDIQEKQSLDSLLSILERLYAVLSIVTERQETVQIVSKLLKVWPNSRPVYVTEQPTTERGIIIDV